MNVSVNVTMCVCLCVCECVCLCVCEGLFVIMDCIMIREEL